MASRIEVADVTIPANTAIATPQNTPIRFNDGVVQRIEIRVPPGPSGLVGFRITHSGDVVIPYKRDRWIVADNELLPWDIENYPTGDAWGIQAYNTDIYDHTLYLRFFLVETGRNSIQPVTVLAISQIAPSSHVEDTIGE